MLNLSSFSNLELPGGFVLIEVTEVDSTLIDAIGRPALAKTTIVGRQMSIALAAGMEDIEKSRSIYHEILEGLVVAFAAPPAQTVEFNEADFEAAAIAAHARFGFADPLNLIKFLRDFGF